MRVVWERYRSILGFFAGVEGLDKVFVFCFSGFYRERVHVPT